MLLHELNKYYLSNFDYWKENPDLRNNSYAFSIKERIEAIWKLVSAALHFLYQSLHALFSKFYDVRRTDQVKKPDENPPYPYHNQISIQLAALNDQTCKGCIIGVYITTNEIGLEEVRQTLETLPRVEKSCHIGFSGWYNFDIMVLRQSSYGLICDFNPNNKLFIEKTLKYLKQSDNRQDFVSKINSYITACDIHTFSLNVETQVLIEEEAELELNRAGSWLSSDENFQFIKKMACEDRIAAITTNITDVERFEKIAAIFAANLMVIDSLYLSNIHNYMFTPANRQNYATTIGTLISPNTIVISCDDNCRQMIDETAGLNSSSANCK